MERDDYLQELWSDLRKAREYEDIEQATIILQAIDLRMRYLTAMRHVAWACRTCNKIDWVDSKEQIAKPEHIAHRGVDIGTCDGEFIELYVKEV